MLRIERLLANRGYCQRSHAKGFLRAHEVTAGGGGGAVGGRIDKPDARVDPASVFIDGVPIDPPVLVLLLHKPVGVVCSHREDAGSGGPSGPLVYSLLPERWQYRDPPISSVGRLDKDTSGLLLLTDDGQLLHRLTSPKHHVPRVYLATLARDLRGDEAAQFASGTMLLKDDPKPLLPATLEVLSPRSARVTLTEGRYHQVRRMFAALGNHVETLHRDRFGPLTLADLPEGAHRPLTPDEEQSLRSA